MCHDDFDSSISSCSYVSISFCSCNGLGAEGAAALSPGLTALTNLQSIDVGDKGGRESRASASDWDEENGESREIEARPIEREKEVIYLG